MLAEVGGIGIWKLKYDMQAHVEEQVEEQVGKFEDDKRNGSKFFFTANSRYSNLARKH